MYNKRRGRGERREGSHRETFHVQSARVFSLSALSSTLLPLLLLLSLSTPKLKMLEGPESHRGAIRVCCSPSVLPFLSSPLPPLQAQSHSGGEEFTGSVRWGGAPLQTIMTLQAVLFMGGLLIKYAAWLNFGLCSVCSV